MCVRDLQAWAEVLGVRLRLPGPGESSVPGSRAPESKFPHRAAKLWRLGPKRALEKESQLLPFLHSGKSHPLRPPFS